MRPSPWHVLVLVGALAGLVFASVSTYDFVQHLDRQVHSLHCSFLPGGHAATGASGCQAAMMSPYSSVFRTSIWGGIPISLAAVSVFAFILFYGTDLLLTRRGRDPRATGFLALATALPAATSLVMLTISLVKLGTTCKLCVGVYGASALCLIGGITTWRRAALDRATRAEPIATAKQTDNRARLEIQVEAPAASNRFLATMFATGVGFVLMPVLLYVAMAPDHSRFIGACGELAQPADTYGVMVDVHRGGEAHALEVLDPLCPACKAFEARLSAGGFDDRLDRQAILFPLDTTCNWMITENTHPGACTVSEAVLCAGPRAPDVIAWAFEVQDRIRAETARDPGAAARMVAQRFPDLATCVGSPEARSRLNKSLRWAVANNIRVMTPQLFVNGTKLCDEDVDLGLDFALSRLIARDAPPPALARPVEAPPDNTPAAGAPTTAATPAVQNQASPSASATAPASAVDIAPAPGATPAPASNMAPTTHATTPAQPTAPSTQPPAPSEPPPAPPAAPVTSPSAVPDTPPSPAPAPPPAAPSTPPAAPAPPPAAAPATPAAPAPGAITGGNS